MFSPETYGLLKNSIGAVDGKIGDLSQLETTAKDNLVNAINEIGGGASSNPYFIDLDVTTPTKSEIYNMIVEARAKGLPIFVKKDDLFYFTPINMYAESGNVGDSGAHITYILEDTTELIICNLTGDKYSDDYATFDEIGRIPIIPSED